MSRSAICVGAAGYGGLCLLTLALAGCNGSDAQSTPTVVALPATSTPEFAEVLPLQRFHYAVTVTVRGPGPTGQPSDVIISTEGDFQSPDRHAFTHTIIVGPFTQRRSGVVITEQAWLQAADGIWQPLPRSDPTVQGLVNGSYSTARPDFLGSPFLPEVQQATARLPASEENVNGVLTSHYRVGAEGEQYFRTFLADDRLLGGRQQPLWELWLANDALWPVRVLLSAQVPAGSPALEQLGITGPATVELRIDVSRPDDPALLVHPPA